MCLLFKARGFAFLRSTRLFVFGDCWALATCRLSRDSVCLRVASCKKGGSDDHAEAKGEVDHE